MDSLDTDAIQKQIFQLVGSGDTEGLKQILPQLKSTINFLDENGMSPLHHACCKGKDEMVQILLDLGADINYSQHAANYTPLHFAALSGNAKTCRLILETDIDIMATNSISRTAAQMAAFVGNYTCVELINNFVSRSVIEEFTKLRRGPKVAKVPMIPIEKIDDFQNFVIDSNLHPVHIILNLKQLGLIKCLPEIPEILRLMCIQEMTKSEGTNELLAFKFHYLSWIAFHLLRCEEQCKTQRETLAAANRANAKANNDVGGGDADSVAAPDAQNDVAAGGHDIDNELGACGYSGASGSTGAGASGNAIAGKSETTKTDKNDAVEVLIKRLLKETKQNDMEYFEYLVRECTREFQYRETNIFRSIIAQLTTKDPMPALAILKQTVIGQRPFTDFSYCSTCGADNADKKCSKCKEVKYCDRECQRLHWFVHKKVCTRPQPGSSKGKVAKQPIDMNELKKELSKVTQH